MTSLRRPLTRAGLVAALAALLLLGRPAPEQARANPLCDAASSPANTITGGLGAITGGAIGGGNPVGDACNAVTGDAVGAVTSPVTGALKDVGNGVLNQVATWVSQGAAWLIGRVAKAIDASTSPRLDTRGFLDQYAKMAEIAVVMAAAMLLLAVLEGLAQGSLAALARTAFLDLPLALIGTSVAFVVVQLLLGATDGLSEAISSSTAGESQRFFADAIHSLVAAGGAPGGAIGASSGGGAAGAALGAAGGSVEAPLFVTFLVAVIGAFAAFFVWIELLMRDAAIYVVALFVPLSLAASIWPRWSGALRRTVELLLVVIASKFVIVAILSLAGSLLAHNAGQVEQILAASALMLLACFSPIVLLRLVPFAEGAMSAAYSRRSATGGALAGVHLATQVQMMRNMAHANWRGSGATETRHGGGRSGGSPGASPGVGPRGGGGPPSGGGPGSTAGSGAGGGAAAGSTAAAAPAAALALPVGAAKGSKGAAERLGHTASAKVAGDGSARQTSTNSTRSADAPRPQSEPRPTRAAPAEKDSRSAAASEPPEAKGGGASGGGERAPRPAAEPSTPRPSEAKRGE